jgi:hypothetical protein
MKTDTPNAPSTIDPHQLPRTALLTQREVGSILRKSRSSLEKWRRSKTHPLKWTLVDGWPRVRCGDLIDYIEAHVGIPHPLTDKAPSCQPRR